MDIKNIAMVRATNIIPFDGYVKPLSEVAYIKKDTCNNLSNVIGDLLKEQKNYNLYNEDEFAVYKKELAELLPYSSDYNSMVLFALNGIVPDDMNNTFSNKSCAIIESLDSQIEKAQFISLVPTDTAIKGTVTLSENATILISENRYNALSQEEKDLLSSSKPRIQTFEGEITEAVQQVLIESGIYPAETLSLKRERHGYMPSETSETLIDTINQIAAEHDIPQALFFNILTHQTEHHDKLIAVKNEVDNIHKVKNWYENEAYKYIFEKMDINKDLQYKMINFGNAKEYRDELGAAIESFGMDNYKKIVEEYNLMVEQLKDNNLLPTPQEIVNFTDGNRPHSMIELAKNSKSNQTRELIRSKCKGEHSTSASEPVCPPTRR